MSELRSSYAVFDERRFRIKVKIIDQGNAILSASSFVESAQSSLYEFRNRARSVPIEDHRFLLSWSLVNMALVLLAEVIGDLRREAQEHQEWASGFRTTPDQPFPPWATDDDMSYVPDELEIVERAHMRMMSYDRKTNPKMAR